MEVRAKIRNKEKRVRGRKLRHRKRGSWMKKKTERRETVKGRVKREKTREGESKENKDGSRRMSG